MYWELDFSIYHDPSELDSTGYMEIGPGRYTGSHWQEGFLFVWCSAFTLAEGIIRKYFPSYDRLAMNDIPKTPGLLVIDDWCKAARALPVVDLATSSSVLNIDLSVDNHLQEVIQTNCHQIAQLLGQLADECSHFYAHDDWMCVQGI
jgi:hypothetical protein